MGVKRRGRRTASRATAADAGPAARPLALLPPEALRARFEAAIHASDGVIGAHCIHEAWMRGEWPARVEQALERLWRAAAGSVPDWLPMRYIAWLPQVYEVAARFHAPRDARTSISCCSITRTVAQEASASMSA